MKKVLLGSHPTTAAHDAGLLLLRLVLGVVLIAHGWQKLVTNGFDATATGFDMMGIPLHNAAAAFSITVELGGGVLLILGALTPIVGLLVAANMAGAFWYAHKDAFFAQEGGYEFVLTLGVIGVALAATGAGRLSVDRFIAGTPAAVAAEPTPASQGALSR